MGYSTQSWPENPATMEPILQPHLGRGPNQQSCPTVLRQNHSPPSLHSALQELPYPKTDRNSRSHLPKDIISRHTQKLNLSWLVKTISAKANPWSLKRSPITQIFRYQHKESRIMKKQVCHHQRELIRLQWIILNKWISMNFQRIQNHPLKV